MHPGYYHQYDYQPLDDTFAFEEHSPEATPASDDNDLDNGPAESIEDITVEMPKKPAVAKPKPPALKAAKPKQVTTSSSTTKAVAVPKAAVKSGKPSVATLVATP